MAMFGIPGYGGGMFPPESPFGGPIDFGMEGINQALDQNAAIGATQPKRGFGEFLKAFAGHLGDNLSGNPVYAQQQQAMQEQQRLMEMYERKRQDEMADYEARKQIDAKYQSPDLPGLADEYNWYNQQPPENQQDIQNYMKMRYPGQFVPPAPVTLPYGAQIEGSGGPQPGTVEDGYRFKGGNPGDPSNWEKVGGPSLGGSGGFPY